MTENFAEALAGGWVWLGLSAVLCASVTGVATSYARKRRLLDMPGRRRSHSQPTPRGGGIGIVAAVLAGLIVVGYAIPDSQTPWSLVIAVTMVALAGWLDDHRPLPASVRLLVHCLAVAAWLFVPILALLHSLDMTSAAWWTAGMALATTGFVAVWSINLHNFMDGIDGLLSLHAVFVLVALAVLCLHDRTSWHALWIGLWVAAIVGFIPFNFPRAHVFMGDVGSGTIGLLIAVAAIWQFTGRNTAVASGLVAASAFVTDSGCTLLSRMFRGRRWYRAHREHLYQWMVRTGMSHVRVVAWYMGWNLLIALPVLCWINRDVSGGGWLATALLYLLAVLTWIGGKQWCLHKFQTRLSHVAA